MDDLCNKRGQNKKWIYNGSVEVASLVDKMRENSLRWLEHVLNREEIEAARIKEICSR